MVRINTNLPALMAWRQAGIAEGKVSLSMERLATGLRIIRAADDPSNLGVSERMRSQVRGHSQAIRNVQQEISLLQTAEGGLNETHEMLHRIRELLLASLDGTKTAEDRLEIQGEIDQLKEEIDRIANTTAFNRKNLLDGTTATLYSTDRLTTEVFPRDSIRTVDKQGHIESGAGNYELSIRAERPGTTQVQMTGTMQYRQDREAVTNLEPGDTGITAVEGENLLYESYAVTSETEVEIAAETDNPIVRLQGDQAAGNEMIGVATDPSREGLSGTFGLEIVEIDGDDLTYKTTFSLYDLDGNLTQGTFQETLDTSAADWQQNVQIFGAGADFQVDFHATPGDFQEGARAVLSIDTGNNTGGAIEIDRLTIGSDSYDVNAATVSFSTGGFDDKTTSLNIVQLDADGVFSTGTITLEVDELADSGTDTTFDFELIAEAGGVASGDTELYDIGAFWDESGNFLLDDSRRLTLYQGDGQKATIDLYGSDTLNDLTRKFSEAIYEGLDQQRVVSTGDKGQLVNYVEEGQAEPGTHESVEGTMVVRSAVAGRDGELYFAGDEGLLKALALNTVQESRETTFLADVINLLDGSTVAQNEKISGNELLGTVHPHVDVRFDNMADIGVSWDDAGRKFNLESISAANGEAYLTRVHLANNTLVAHIGPNPGQDLISSIGRMDTAALGIDNVLAVDRESANLALGRIDGAINRVSSQRAQIGSMVNRLQHTMENLMVSRENITASESLIRDVDVPWESMELVKNQIKLETSLAMLSQANLQHQRVFRLLFDIQE